MLTPLSWLKEYVDIKMSPTELGERLTEVGLGVEKITKVDDDVIFELEITPNRADLLSIVGIAQEIAAIEGLPAGRQGKKIKLPTTKVDLKKAKPSKILPLEIKTDPLINPRFTAIIIDGITVRESPAWLKKRLIKIGQRPINNIVDITNYVMFELGNPIHAFDYNKISEKIMTVEKAKGGEVFKSVDGTSYSLPKGAIIIKDSEKIIDLCGIKGALNSGTFEKTKTIVIRVPVENPILIRRASQSLGLRSEASSIFERGVNKGGTISALQRCVDLIIDLAGGEVASKLYDLKREKFSPWKLKLRLKRLSKILGIEIPERKILSILRDLNLSPRKTEKNIIETTIPTYRNDLKIEEDLIEEVARLYGYNNFPKTMPIGQIPTKQIPYFKDYRLEEKVKNILAASGFSEIYTYGLISEQDLLDAGMNPDNCLRIDNPISREFEYLRPTLTINLKKAFLQNRPHFPDINLFELGKVYRGKNIEEAREEYALCLVSNKKSFPEMKGILEKLYKELGISIQTIKMQSLDVSEEAIVIELNYSELLKNINLSKTFIPLPKYPPMIEDLAIQANEKVKTGDIIEVIKNQSKLIVDVSLLDQFEETRTFHVVYQHKEKSLTKEDVAKIRRGILKSLKEKFGAKLKE